MKVKIENLKFYSKNAKAHPPEQIEKIKRSIEKFGFRGAIQATEDLTIVAGHGRIMALKELGHKEVETEIIKDLKPEDIKAFRLSDNKTAESNWIEDLLQEELKELNNTDYDLSLTGFNDDEIKRLLDGLIIPNEKGEWGDMPEFDNEDLRPYRQIIVSFKNEADIEEFKKLINQNITDKTISIWFPATEIRKAKDKRYE